MAIKNIKKLLMLTQFLCFPVLAMEAIEVASKTGEDLEKCTGVDEKSTEPQNVDGIDLAELKAHAATFKETIRTQKLPIRRDHIWNVDFRFLEPQEDIVKDYIEALRRIALLTPKGSTPLGLNAGAADFQGERKNMQDVYKIHKSDQGLLAAVFDGHGIYGDDLARLCADNMVEHCLPAGAFSLGGFENFSYNFDLQISSDSKLAKDGGTTMVAVWIDAEKLHLANLGDSKAIIVNKDQTYVTTKDHKITNPSENARLLALGAAQLLTKNNPTRSIGDRHLLSKIGGGKIIDSNSENQSFDITPNHDFMVLGSDGAFDDFMKPEEAIQKVRRLRARLCAQLGVGENEVTEAMAEYIANAVAADVVYDRSRGNKRTTDNVALVVIFFNQHAQSLAAQAAARDLLQLSL